MLKHLALACVFVLAGLTHDHTFGLLDRAGQGAIEIVGIAEPNQALARRYAERYDLDPGLLYADLETMLDAVEPDAVPETVTAVTQQIKPSIYPDDETTIVVTYPEAQGIIQASWTWPCTAKRA